MTQPDVYLVLCENVQRRSYCCEKMKQTNFANKSGPFQLIQAYLSFPVPNNNKSTHYIIPLLNVYIYNIVLPYYPMEELILSWRISSIISSLRPFTQAWFKKVISSWKTKHFAPRQRNTPQSSRFSCCGQSIKVIFLFHEHAEKQPHKFKKHVFFSIFLLTVIGLFVVKSLPVFTVF